MVGRGWLGYFGRRTRGKSSQRYRSCGDLTIYPIREIRGNNRIIYGDQFDDDDRGNQARTENVYFVRSAHYHPECLTPAGECCEVWGEEPVYTEILTPPHPHHRYERLSDWWSQPCLHTDHSESGDSGYRSVLAQVTTLTG